MSTPTAAHGALPEEGEREAFEAWMTGRYPDVFSPPDAAHYWLHEHISALAWKARAALSPASPAPAVPSMAFEYLQDALRQLEGKAALAESMCETGGYQGGYRVLKEYAATALEVSKKLAATPAQQTQSDAVAGAEKALDEALAQRDDYHEWADQLAEQIAAITSADIGEHSSSNNPWHEAMLAADDHIANDLRNMLGGEAPYAATPPQQATPTMQDALAAGDGTLHGAIDHWQQRALKAEATLRMAVVSLAYASEKLPELNRDYQLVSDDISAARAALKEAPGGGQ